LHVRSFKNPFARKSAAPPADADPSKPKLSAKEKRQQKKNAYYKKKDLKHAPAATKPPPIQTDPSASNAPEQAPPSATVSAASPASRAVSPTSSLGGNSAASPSPNAADVASVGSGDPNGGVDVDAALSPVAEAHNTPALMNLSGSSEVETYQPPRLEAEKRKAEAAAAAANGGEAATGEESPEEGGETPGANPTCNYCGCFT
jgi:hypothetical protein